MLEHAKNAKRTNRPKKAKKVLAGKKVPICAKNVQKVLKVKKITKKCKKC